MNAFKPQGDGALLTFTDKVKIGTWAQKSVAQAMSDGIISGYEDGAFRPDAEITRPEMVMMIAKALSQTGGSAAVTGFADDKFIPDWSKGTVAAMKQAGIIEGKGSNTFAPSDKTTRAEAVTVMLKMHDGEKSLIDQLYRMRTVKEIGQWFREALIYPMMELFEYMRISDQMLDMIHHEMETDLSLDLCATRLGYHPDYIRGIFRREAGINFSEYLSSFRLQKAKEMLVDTELKISEIAERLRYNNSQNFIRYSRKQEGMTLGQYREKTY